MTQGRFICNTLKAIRKQIADANDIVYEPHDCKHEGPCLGTCPACEAEVSYLERQLDLRRQLGRAVAVVGLSAGLVGLTTGCASKKAVTSHPSPGIDEPLGGDVPYTSPEHPPVMGIPPIHEPMAAPDSALLKPMATNENNKIFGDATEQMPMFRGGERALQQYIKENVRWPEGYEGRAGRVIVTFVIERDGSIHEAKVVRSSAPELDEEALRVVNNMPKWFPGSRNGKTVRVKYTLPVTFPAR